MHSLAIIIWCYCTIGVYLLVCSFINGHNYTWTYLLSYTFESGYIPLQVFARGRSFWKALLRSIQACTFSKFLLIFTYISNYIFTNINIRWNSITFVFCGGNELPMVSWRMNTDPESNRVIKLLLFCRITVWSIYFAIRLATITLVHLTSSLNWSSSFVSYLT